MDKTLYLLSKQYVSCCDTIETLIAVKGLPDAERTDLFQLIINRITGLEKEMENCLVEKDLVDMMVKQKGDFKNE